jgi:hypothetical protein
MTKKLFNFLDFVVKQFCGSSVAFRAGRFIKDEYEKYKIV